MSTESDDKVQSKFPRTSLRARNKTLMVTPADVADYQVRSEKHVEMAVNLGDVVEDSLLTIDDAFGLGSGVASIGSDATHAGNSQPMKNEDYSTGNALADVWESDERREEIERVEENLEAMLPEDAPQDMLVAPDGTLNDVDGWFSEQPVSAQSDPIVREVRSVKSSVTHKSGQSVSSSVYGDSSKHSYEIVASSALKNAAQGLRQVNREQAESVYTEYVDWKKKTKLVGFLVSYKVDLMGSYIELREGRLLVTSEQTCSDSCLVIGHESVSPMHAIMRISADGSILILDQLSEHGTKIRRGEAGKEDALMGDKSTIHHGDVVIFGECEYHVVVMGAAALKREA